MKNNFVISIALILTIYISGCCIAVKPSHDYIYPIKFSNMDWQLNNDGTELDVKFEILSDFADDACLILNVEKEISGKRNEGFRDSLVIDGFYVRSYSIKDTNRIINGLITPVDFPVYIKEVFIHEGINREIFKIIFPKNIELVSGSVYVEVGIFKFDDEIKGKFELLNQWWSARNKYFKVFPDSSNTSYVFTDPPLIKDYTTFHGSEKISTSFLFCIDSKDVSYFNHYFNEKIYIKR